MTCSRLLVFASLLILCAVSGCRVEGELDPGRKDDDVVYQWRGGR